MTCNDLRRCREEGVRAFWKGNGTNVVRIFPYSAVQFSANEHCLRFLASKVPGHGCWGL